MATLSRIQVKIHSRDRRDLEPRYGYLELHSWDRAERSRNALRTFGIWIGIAFGCILIPFFHFFLVPTAVITAFALALKKLEEESAVLCGFGQCPECQADLSISAGSKKDRYLETCGKCFHNLEISLQIEDR